MQSTNVNDLPIAIAWWDFDTREDGMMSFKEGDKLRILEQDEGGWWKASNGENSGYVPSNYLKLLSLPSPSPSNQSTSSSPQPNDLPIAIAWWDFHALDDSMMSFKEGDKLRILEQNGDEWWKASSIDGENIGYVPSNYLKLLSLPSPSPSNQSTSSSPQPNDLPIAIAWWDFDTREDGMMSFKEGDRLRILEQNEDEWWKASNGENSGYVPSNYLKLLSLPSPSSSNQSTSSRPQPNDLPIAIAWWDFDAREDGMMPFKEGDKLRILEQNEDEWWKASSIDGENIGYVPSNYLRIEKKTDARADQ